MKIKVINESGFPLPSYATALSAGADVFARLPGAIGLRPGESVVIPTGLFIELPEGYEVQVRPKSGIAAKKAVTVLNTPGTVDADYRGEIGVILINHGKSIFRVEPGAPIAQLVLAKYEQIEWITAEELTDTERGEGGFGSTGTEAKEPLEESADESPAESPVAPESKPEESTPVAEKKPVAKKPAAKKPAVKKPVAKKTTTKK